MPRDYKVYLEDIVEAIGKIREYTTGLPVESFLRDSKTIDAVVRNLEIVGEAIKNVPEEIRMQHLDIEWRKIAGLRDILIHEYFGIDSDIIWDIIQNKLPVLEAQVRTILQT
ncbi:MAG: DUF86 domain-containing protein [Deltaproteobacteria bacterium]|nr:DUF86 domain-containing protein [Deltaproteobacteria bacterium]